MIHSMRTSTSQASSRLSLLLLLCLVPLSGWAEGTEPREPSQAVCEGLTLDRVRSAHTSRNMKVCCDRIFRNASVQNRSELNLGTSQFTAAGAGKLVCIDEWSFPKGDKSQPKWVRRNVISGPNTGLSAVTALTFVPHSARPQILIADGEEHPRVVTFNYRFDGNVYPEREYRRVGSSPVFALGIDEARGNLVILSRDGRLRKVSLAYNDLGLRPEERSKVDAETSEAYAIREPSAFGMSSVLGRVFVLDTEGKLSTLNLKDEWKEEPIESILDSGVSDPQSFKVSEDPQSGEVRVEITDSKVATYSLLISPPKRGLNDSGSSPRSSEK